MNDQIRQIAQRIKELREILDVAAVDLAKQVNLPVEEYLNYEEAKTDIPIGVIYGVAAALNVDPTVLLTPLSARGKGWRSSGIRATNSALWPSTISAASSTLWW